MRQTVLADTGPLYAAADPSDEHHGRAQAELARLEREGWVVAVAHPILSEAYTLVLRRLDLPHARRWLQEVTGGVSLITPTTEDYVGAVRTIPAYPDQSLTLFDALLAVLSRREQCPVWTYDRHFDVLRVSVWR